MHEWCEAMPPCHSQGTGAEAAASQGPLSLMAGCNCRSACNSAAVPRLGLQRRLHNTLPSPVLRNTQRVRTRAGGLSRGSSGARGRAGTAACGLYRSGSRVEQPCMPPLLPCTPVLCRAAACSLPRGDQAAGTLTPSLGGPSYPLQRQVASRHPRTCTCSRSAGSSRQNMLGSTVQTQT